jgi:uncharacterized protein
MPSELGNPHRHWIGIRRNPVIAYFALTYAISWMGALVVAAPYLIHHQPLPKMAGIVMFPAMLLGPCISGIVLTRIVDGKPGVRHLFSQMSPARVPARWYGVLLIPPLLILAVLFGLQTFVSSGYAPNLFLIGILFGIPAGFLEEIGWTGYAFPKMCSRSSALAASIELGLLWSLWHLPAINYLGTATPHGAFWLWYFVSFTLAMTAMRVLIAWVYTNTNSVWLAQLVHVSSTGSLVIFSPPHVSAAQEAMWYALYGILVWAIVVIVVINFGPKLSVPGLQRDCQR